MEKNTHMMNGKKSLIEKLNFGFLESPLAGI